MKILFSSILVLIILLLSCKKYNDAKDDANSKFYIYGRLFIRDSLNDNGTEKPLLKQEKIWLYYKNDPTNILVTARTDSFGYFIFQNLKQDAEYTIASETETGTDNNKLLFSTTKDATLNSSITNLTLLLQPDEKKQNGALITITDSSGIITGSRACFYSSRRTWGIDTCNFSDFSLTSNMNGQVLKTNLTPGWYYVWFKKELGTSLTLFQKDSIEIKSIGLSRKRIVFP